MKKLTKNEMENKLERLLMEVNLLCEVYQNDKAHQVRLSRLSEQISDVYAMIYDLPAINNVERQSWQKERKLQMKLYGISTTVSMLTTIHQKELTKEEEKEVLKRVDELLVQLNEMKKDKVKRNSDECKECLKEYLDLKSKLNEPVSFEYKNAVMNKPRQLTIDEYTLKSVMNIIKNIHYFEMNDVETFNDIKQALNVTKFTYNQTTAINQGLADGRVDKALSKDFELACQKVFKVLTEKNVYKMKQINFF